MKKLSIFLILNSAVFANSLELVDDGLKLLRGEKVVSTIEDGAKILKIAKLSKVTKQMLTNPNC